MSEVDKRAASDRRGRRIVGEELAGDLVRRYAEGESIRDLVTSTGCSYGTVHRILAEAGVRMRPPGRRKGHNDRTAAAGPETHDSGRRRS